MEVLRNRGRERKIWTDEDKEDMMIMGIKMEGMEEDFTGSQGAQRTVGHEEEEEKKKKKKKKKGRRRRRRRRRGGGGEEEEEKEE